MQEFYLETKLYYTFNQRNKIIKVKCQLWALQGQKLDENERKLLKNEVFNFFFTLGCDEIRYHG